MTEPFVLDGRQDVAYSTIGSTTAKIGGIISYKMTPAEHTVLQAPSLQTPKGQTKTVTSQRLAGQTELALSVYRDFSDTNQAALFALAGTGTKFDVWGITRDADGTVAEHYLLKDCILKPIADNKEDNTLLTKDLVFMSDFTPDYAATLPVAIPATLAADA